MSSILPHGSAVSPLTPHSFYGILLSVSAYLVIVDVYKADYPMRGPLPQGFSGTPTPDEHKYLFVFVREQDPATLVSFLKSMHLYMLLNEV